MNEDHTPWDKGPIVGYDIETTGVDPTTARIVSAAIILDVPGKELVIHDWLVNPGIDIPLECTAVHGISTETAQEKGIDPGKACLEITATMVKYAMEYGQIPLVVYNAVYDLTILDREIYRNGMGEGLTVPLPIIDPMVADRKLDKYRRGRRTLTATTAAYGITIRGAHQASGDVIASIKLARAIAGKYPRFASWKMDKLQIMQAQAHAEFAEHFTKYRRTDDPEFPAISGAWPIIPRG